MSRISRLTKLENELQPEQKPKKVISLMPRDEIEGKGYSENFTPEELEETKQRYLEQYPDHELDFVVFRFVDDWKSVGLNV